MSEWINYMSITKYRVNKHTGQVQHVSGFTKLIDSNRMVSGKPKAKKVKVESSVVEEETI